MHRFSANGYEITAGENEIAFLDRRTWGLAWLMVAMGLLAASLVLLTALSAAGLAEIWRSVGDIVLPACAGLLVIGVWTISRTYRKRRDHLSEEIQNSLIADLSSQVLRSMTGEIVAQLPDVRARMHIDWWTRGAMRIVALGWPGGHRTVYRTFGRRGSLELLTFLKEQGLDAQ
ncbi:hypothetical protein JW848_01585 [Candidatus Bipolaricaulota bacterium]|nr:hypothetical protein [Candidatus Bipolaricaulota bacterium]